MHHRGAISTPNWTGAEGLMSAATSEAPAGGQDTRIIALIGTGHFLSHFYMLCLPPLFLVWRQEFGASYAELGLTVALMSGTTALLQTPVGFAVDRYGARPFLVGGTLIMALAISAMAFAPGVWALWLLAILSGVGNSVIHPADYAILAGSIRQDRMGRAFAMHTFTGNLGFALAPPTIALLMTVMGWREALLLVGLLGVPVVGAILLQSRILKDQAKAKSADQAGQSGRELLLSRPMLLFFAFFLLSAAAGSGIQAFVITVLGKLWAPRQGKRDHGLHDHPDAFCHGDVPGAWAGRIAGNCPAWGRVAGWPRYGGIAHPARCDAEGCLPAGANRQGVWLCLLWPAAGRRDYARAARVSD
jgi:FSR family fosmidomycin resistance protein-like MFS transporter